jgi:hypothetical protein
VVWAAEQDDVGKVIQLFRAQVVMLPRTAGISCVDVGFLYVEFGMPSIIFTIG